MPDDLINNNPDAVASYSYQDVEDGIGAVSHDLFAATDTSGTSYVMAKESPFSDPITINKIDGAVGTTTTNFDTGTFNTPKVVDGIATFTFGVGIKASGGTTTTRFEVKFFHYDGSTATQIGSTWTSALITATGAVAKTKMLTGRVTLPVKKFRKGEQIRVQVGINSVSNGSTPMIRQFGIDPQDRDADQTTSPAGPLTPSSNAEISTTFTVIIPFRLNL